MRGTEGLDQQIRAVWERTRARTFAKLDAVAAVTGAADPPEGDRRAARAATHELAGSIGMYGFAEAGALARRLDDRVVGGALATTAGRAEAHALVAELRAALAREGGAG